MTRTEPTINTKAANHHMPPGFRVIDPDSMMGRAQLAGLEIHGLASAHLAASNQTGRYTHKLSKDLQAAAAAIGGHLWGVLGLQ